MSLAQQEGVGQMRRSKRACGPARITRRSSFAANADGRTAERSKRSFSVSRALFWSRRPAKPGGTQSGPISVILIGAFETEITTRAPARVAPDPTFTASRASPATRPDLHRTQGESGHRPRRSRSLTGRRPTASSRRRNPANPREIAGAVGCRLSTTAVYSFASGPRRGVPAERI